GLAVSIGILAIRPANPQADFAHAIVSRIVSSTDVGSGSVASRINTWRDTLPLIAGRPILGWGPDTFGLVYPKYQSTYRQGEFFDKPHQEVLGVAAAQGLVGVAAYIWILISLIRAFWKGRYLRGAVALFAGLIA